MNLYPKIQEFSAAQLYEMQKANKALIIDVREAEEHQKEHIPNSILFPLSSFDPRKLPEQGDKILVFHCRSGKRSLEAAIITSNFTNKESYHLEGGIISWKNASLPVVSS